VVLALLSWGLQPAVAARSTDEAQAIVVPPDDGSVEQRVMLGEGRPDARISGQTPND